MVASFSFTNSLEYMVEMGIYDVLLPFLLIFSIVFAILEKTKILGKDKININVIVSVVIGLLLVVQKTIVEIINLFLPRVALIMVVILMGILLIAMVVGKEFTGLKEHSLGIAIILIIISIIVALTASPSPVGGFVLTNADKEALLSIGIPLLILLGVIAVVTAKPKEPNDENILKKIAKQFGGS